LPGGTELAVGLALVRGQLSQELVVADARRGGQARVLQDPGANLAGGVGGGGQAPAIGGDVEIGLVQRQRFDQVGVVSEDRVDLPRDGLVDLEPRRHEDQLRALAKGGGRGHGRAHAKLPGLVAGGGDHAAPGAMAHGHGLALEVRIVALFDRRIEGVHVDMDDLARVVGHDDSVPTRPGT
jgi:hypothetical protein